MTIGKMAIIASSLVVLSMPTFAGLIDRANWHGKLDLNLNVNEPGKFIESQGFAYINDRINSQDLAGTLTPLWHLQHKDHEAFHVSFLNAWNFPRKWQYSAFGLSAGVSASALGNVLSAPTSALLAKILPDIYPQTQSQVIGILNHVGNTISLEVGGGYRFFGHTKDVKPWIAGWGVKLNLPISDILPKWINGGNG